MILFADHSVVFVPKPSGMLVHNSAFAGPKEHTLTDVVTEAVGGRPVPLHRLDRGTSGVIGFARTSAYARGWQQALQADAAEKHYVALVRGQLRAPVAIDHPIDDEGVKRDARSDVAPVVTSAEPRCSVVHVRLHTGRQHQARLHLKHLSHPVIGDANYGKGPINRAYCAEHRIRRLALHALVVVIAHPESGERVVVHAALPDDLAAPLRGIFPTLEAKLDVLTARLRSGSVG